MFAILLIVSQVVGMDCIAVLLQTWSVTGCWE